MPTNRTHVVPLGEKIGYTAGVTVRLLLKVAGFAGACVALVASEAQAKGTTQPTRHDLAQGAAQAARAVAEGADTLADAEIQPAQQDSRSPLDGARRGVVVLERHGNPLALGTVLKGDGRILSALAV